MSSSDGATRPITQAMEAAVADGVFPGAVLLVKLDGRPVYERAFGKVGASSPFDSPVTTETIYDLASLTKPLATVGAALTLIQPGELALEDRVDTVLPELRSSPTGGATVFHLLNHSSGLPGWRPLYERLAERKRTVLELVGEEAPEYPTGAKSLYSDLGFILLGLLIERKTDRSLAEFCRSRIFAPLDADPLFFAPERPEGRIPVAPTEDEVRRGRVLIGEVHDQNAWAMGGIAGHAGLFGTARAVGAVTGCWLNGYWGRDSLWRTDLIRRFVSRAGTPGSSWALGWDTPSPPSTSGRYFSPESFGHLGYTGTSIWIDPVRRLEVVLLSNRVHPTSRNTKIQQFRPAIHDVVFETLVGAG